MTAALAEAITDPEPGAWAYLAARDTEARLATALARRDVSLAADVRDAADEAHDRAKRERIPKAARFATAAAVLRAQRVIGLTIRAGQEAGEIRRRGQAQEGGLPGSVELARVPGPSELSFCYALSDGITDERFNAALDAAVRERNVSRANVLRKLGRDPAGGELALPDRSPDAAVRRRHRIKELAAEGYSSRQMAEDPDVDCLPESVRKIAREMGVAITADEVVGRTRLLDPNTAARETAFALEGLADGVALISIDDLDRAEARAWAESMAESLRTLTRYAKQIKEIAR